MTAPRADAAANAAANVPPSDDDMPDAQAAAGGARAGGDPMDWKAAALAGNAQDVLLPRAAADLQQAGARESDDDIVIPETAPSQQPAAHWAAPPSFDAGVESFGGSFLVPSQMAEELAAAAPHHAQALPLAAVAPPPPPLPLADSPSDSVALELEYQAAEPGWRAEIAAEGAAGERRPRAPPGAAGATGDTPPTKRGTAAGAARAQSPTLQAPQVPAAAAGAAARVRQRPLFPDGESSVASPPLYDEQAREQARLRALPWPVAVATGQGRQWRGLYRAEDRTPPAPLAPRCTDGPGCREARCGALPFGPAPPSAPAPAPAPARAATAGPRAAAPWHEAGTTSNITSPPLTAASEDAVVPPRLSRADALAAAAAAATKWRAPGGRLEGVIAYQAARAAAPVAAPQPAPPAPELDVACDDSDETQCCVSGCNREGCLRAAPAAAADDPDATQCCGGLGCAFAGCPFVEHGSSPPSGCAYGPLNCEDTVVALVAEMAAMADPLRALYTDEELAAAAAEQARFDADQVADAAARAAVHGADAAAAALGAAGADARDRAVVHSQASEDAAAAAALAGEPPPVAPPSRPPAPARPLPPAPARLRPRAAPAAVEPSQRVPNVVTDGQRDTGWEYIYYGGGRRYSRRSEYTAMIKQPGVAQWTKRFQTLEAALKARNAELLRRGLPPTLPRAPKALCFICDKPAHIRRGTGDGMGGILAYCSVLLACPDKAHDLFELLTLLRDRRCAREASSCALLVLTKFHRDSYIDGDIAKYNEALAYFPDADAMEPHEPMPEWRVALWSQMDGVPTFPEFGLIRDPHSGDVISFLHKKGSGKYAILEHRLKSASGDRLNNMVAHYLRNLYWTSGFYNLHVRRDQDVHQSYVSMAAWLRFTKYISWGPSKAPVAADHRWFTEYIAYATRCYLRHLHCAASCRWCGGYFVAGAAGLVHD